MKKSVVFVVSAIVLLLLFLFLHTSSPKDPVKLTRKPVEKKILTIFHAGSLSVPFADIEKIFEAANPTVDVQREIAGSRSCARKITDLHKPADIMASADESVIATLLMPEFTAFNIKFARNEMAIMFTEQSKFKDEITAENWSKILLRKGVRYGHSDPNKDPCGYRSQLVWQLEEKRTGIKGLYQKLRKKMNPADIRPKETDLLALLETGEIDYLFIYRSVAEQHHGKYILLPKEINLGNQELAKYYSSASIKISGKKPGTTVTKKGTPMIYGITILRNAPQQEIAIQFLDFLLSEKGESILKKHGQPVIKPAKVSNINLIPQQIQKWCRAGS